MTDELVAVYDAEGNAIGAAPRSRVYAEGLWHASAGVLVRSVDGRGIYVHRRSDTKAVFAGMHDCLAGGVVDPGESALQAATRELSEELGIGAVALTPLAAAAWDGQWAGKPMRCHLFAFEARWDGAIRHQPEEVVDGWWWTDAELAAHLADPHWPFVPDTRVLIPQLLGPSAADDKAPVFPASTDRRV
ncbi:NUDIX domain-containing protein [Mycobacterium sp. TNTM28]|uniref:NUDIX domain-containing protein n=1 Tax=[Mycobacterium] fortunisiensis TaxID=2600579 RepID=A0ABS6KJB3_9MYCO|nr:NUDIX domain-containing protein [[Mycobacterium] fortunisiensis]MBU9763697.1 NUDIX domain-containing protein [[Mycobacterium] fortunisiensis]